jgi:hypothetical protein
LKELTESRTLRILSLRVEKWYSVNIFKLPVLGHISIRGLVAISLVTLISFLLSRLQPILGIITLIIGIALVILGRKRDGGTFTLLDRLILALSYYLVAGEGRIRRRRRRKRRYYGDDEYSSLLPLPLSSDLRKVAKVIDYSTVSKLFIIAAIISFLISIYSFLHLII